MEDFYYRVSNLEGQSCKFCYRDEAYNWYENNNGAKIEILTKDLFPKVVSIIDVENFNLERIRENLTIKKTSEALRNAINKYDKENAKQFCLKLNKNTDKDIIEYLDSIENKQGFIKELIRDKMKKEC